jgi:hypothetical protein
MLSEDRWMRPLIRAKKSKIAVQLIVKALDPVEGHSRKK